MLTSCPSYGGSREIGVAAGAANLRGAEAEGTNYGVTVIKLLSLRSLAPSTDESSVVRLPLSSGDLLRREIHIGLGKTCPSKFAFFCGSLSLSVEKKIDCSKAKALLETWYTILRGTRPKSKDRLQNSP